MKEKFLTISYFFIITLYPFQTVFGMSLVNLSAKKFVEYIIENRIDPTNLKEYPSEIQDIIFEQLLEQKTSIIQKWINLQTVQPTGLDPNFLWKNILDVTRKISIISAFAISPDKQTLFIGDFSKIHMYTKNIEHRWTLSQTFPDPATLSGANYLNLDSSRCPAVITSIAFSPDGKTIASSSTSNFVNIYTKIKIISELWTITEVIDSSDKGCTYGYVDSVAFSPDGKTLAAGTLAVNDKIKFYAQNDLGLWNLFQTVKSDNISSLVFSPDGQFLASGSKDFCSVEIFTKNSSGLWYSLNLFFSECVRKTTSVCLQETTSVAFSPDSKMLAAGSISGTVDIYRNDYDTHWKYCYSLTPKIFATPEMGYLELRNPNGIRDLVFSPNGKILFILLNSDEIKYCTLENTESITSLVEYIDSFE